jgi:hypothetical protein
MQVNRYSFIAYTFLHFWRNILSTIEFKSTFGIQE